MGKTKGARTSWQEKLRDSKGLPKVERITGKMSKRWGTGTVVIPAPMEVDEIMRSVPSGKLITVNLIREKLAKKHGSTIACPITTGIFAWVAANAAEEARAQGRTSTTPYWRTLKSKGELNSKYPGGVKAQAAHLKEEGHIIERRGHKGSLGVKDFQSRLVSV